MASPSQPSCQRHELTLRAAADKLMDEEQSPTHSLTRAPEHELIASMLRAHCDELIQIKAPCLEDPEDLVGSCCLVWIPAYPIDNVMPPRHASMGRVFPHALGGIAS